MNRLIPALFVDTAMLVLGAVYAQPGYPAKPDFPVGKWRIEFTNRVVEVCDIGWGGESYVDEPLRRSKGMAEVRDSKVVITFADDRVERWTQVGDRFVVEHWAQGSRLPTLTPVLGIAERIHLR